MIYSLMLYLLKASVSLLLFLVIYRVVLSSQTHFAWMRAYLLVSVVLSLLIPLVKVPFPGFSFTTGGIAARQDGFLFSLDPGTLFSSRGAFQRIAENPGRAHGGTSMFILILGFLYVCGVIWKAVLFTLRLARLRALFKKGRKRRVHGIWKVETPMDEPAFSFWNILFMNSALDNLGEAEREKIELHETQHIRQYHTLDRLMVEGISLILWFHPLIGYLQRSIRDVHEYLADGIVIREPSVRKEYSELLLKLAVGKSRSFLSTGFTDKQIFNRITMMTREKSPRIRKLRFAVLIPVTVFLWIPLSLVQSRETQPTGEVASAVLQSGADRVVGTVQWEGNTVFRSSRLSRVLALKEGDPYVYEQVNKKVWMDMDGIATLYFDKGYVFFHADIREEDAGEGVVNLTISLYEGIPAKVGEIRITGIDPAPEAQARQQLKIKSGDWFSKTQIVKSLNAIKELDELKGSEIKVTPVPVPEKATEAHALVDIEFEITNP